MNSVIIGIGASLPEKIVTNDDLSKTVDTSDEWIKQRTGISSRHIASNSETTSSLATNAAKLAMENAKVNPSDIDLIIVGTVTPDYTFPSVATLVQRNLGITIGAAFDLGAACSGFVYALDVADSYLKLGKAKTAIVIGSETFSKIVDWSDRSTCVLFGDGAGAVVLQSQDTPRGIQSTSIFSDGRYAESLITTGGVSVNQSTGFVKMDGREVFRHAVEKMKSSIDNVMKNNNISINDIDLIIPHQANARIILNLAEQIGIDKNKIVFSIEKYANTSAASIPLAMNSVREKLAGKNIMLVSMGAGFTWGASFVKM